MVNAANAWAWAIGKPVRSGFKVRRVLWGRALARKEKRDGEQVRRAIVVVSTTGGTRRAGRSCQVGEAHMILTRQRANG